MPVAADLQLAWCSHAAASHAVKSWHYSRTMPVGKIVRIGVWEHGEFIGAVLFSRGASPALGNRFGVEPLQVVELVRVALRSHAAPVSRVVAQALRMLRQQSPGLRLVVSFADPLRGHLGIVYQAGNWVYTGQGAPNRYYSLHGKLLHNRAFSGRQFGTGAPSKLPPEAKVVLTPGKHRYAYPFDRAMRRRLETMRVPFPRGQRLDGEPPTSRVGGSGSTPDGRSTGSCH